MSDKAVEAESHGAGVSLPPKPAMEAEAPPPYVPQAQAQAAPEAGFQLNTLNKEESGPPSGDLRSMFMDPMFAELEARVKEHEKILDKINDDMKMEREMERKAKEQAHLPGPLKGSGQELSEVMKKVEEMIVYEIDEDEKEEEENKEEETPFSFMETWIDARRKKGLGQEPEEEENQEIVPQKPQKERKRMQIRKLDAHGNAAVTSHSLAAYVSCLQDEHLKRFTSKITADTQLWLSKMFRFDEGSVFYHDEPRDGLVRVCRLALYQKYPKYVTEGFEALYSRPPVLYISSAAPPGLSNYLCLQLGLPMSCICSVPCNTLFGSNTKMRPNRHQRMDTEILEKLIQDDIAAAKTPVALVAYAGTPNAGHVDDLETIRDLCKKNNIWMHVEGDNLATLALLHPPTDIQNARFGDSFTVCIGKWLGIPATPYATMFKVEDPVLVHAASLMTFDPNLKLSCLPLWVVLQSLGIEQIEQRIINSCDLAEFMFAELARIKTIKQLSREEKKKDDKAIRSISDLITKAINALLVFEMVTPTVVFRYTEDATESSNIAVAPYAVGSAIEPDDDTDEEVIKKKTYYNSLNIWLGETLQAENPNVEITIVELEREGVCMRFCPLESAQLLGTEKEHLQAFIACLRNQIAILDATTLNYEKFRLITADQENLRLVEVGNWAGLGAVQYIPSAYVKEGLKLDDEVARKEVNNLNIELVHKLKDTDSAFSLGYADNEIACVKFGLITDDTDVSELVSMVQETGKQVEETSKYFESMSELVRKGIEEANKDLQEENEHKLVQEGVLRQIPMIGSVMNWFSPPPKDAVKGRTFNLVSGTIASTEETYKYKMQVQADGGSTSRSRQTSGTGSVASTTSASSPRSQQGDVPVSPNTKTAGDIKAGLVNSVHEGELSEGQESLPSPNGNLRLDLENQEVEDKTQS